MSGLWTFLLVLVYTLTCLFVIMTILLQSGKGGGLSSLGSGAGGALSDSLGATGAEKTLVKATSWGSGVFLALSLILTLYGSHLEKTGGLAIGETPASAPAQAPASNTPAEAPEGAPSQAPASAPASSSIPEKSAPVAGEKVEKPVSSQPASESKPAAESKPASESKPATEPSSQK